jgi:hypothetical protein
MDGLAHRVAEYTVNHLMPFDQAFAFELLANDQCFEMISAAGRVADFDVGARQPSLDHLLQFRDVHHRDYPSLCRQAKSTSLLVDWPTNQPLSDDVLRAEFGEPAGVIAEQPPEHRVRMLPKVGGTRSRGTGHARSL